MTAVNRRFILFVFKKFKLNYCIYCDKCIIETLVGNYCLKTIQAKKIFVTNFNCAKKSKTPLKQKPFVTFNKSYTAIRFTSTN